MAEPTHAPVQTPTAALTEADKARRVESARHFLELSAQSLAAQSKGDLSPSKRRELNEKAFEALNAYLLPFGALQLDVAATAFSLHDEPLAQEGVMAEIAGRLHAEGARQIVFLRGMTASELASLSDNVLTPTAQTHGTHAERLWEARLRHVRIEAAWARSFPGMKAREVEAELNRLSKHLFEEMRRHAQDMHRFLQHNPDETSFTGSVPPGHVVIAGCPASVELKARLQDAIARDEAALFSRAVDALFSNLEAGRFERLEDLERFLADLVDERLRLHDLSSVAQLIQRIEALEHRSETAMNGYRLRCSLQGVLSRPERLKPVCALLVQGKLLDPESVRSYLVNLDSEAISPLIELLPSISLAENRALAREALARAGKGAPGLFVTAFKSAKGETARDLLRVIDACDFVEKFACFEEALRGQHGDLKIDALELISRPGNIETETARRLMANALNAGDAQLRLAALEGLRKVGDARVGKTLLGAMQSAVFDKRDFDERKRFFEVLGSLNLPTALPFLSQLLAQKKKGLFGNARLREDKLLAIHALSQMALIPAYKILQGAAEDSENDSKVRESAREALATMRQALSGAAK